MPPFEHEDATREILAATLHDVPDAPEPLLSSRSITRGTTIIGQMLEYLGDRYGQQKKPGVVLAIFGRVAFGLVELAAPRSLGQILFQYWIAIAYALSILMILVGIVTSTSSVTRGGYLVLIVSVVANIVVEKLRRWMNTKAIRQLKPALLAIPLALSAVGGVIVYDNIQSIGAQMERQGAPKMTLEKRASLLQTPADVSKALGQNKQGDVNINLMPMITSLGWDSLFILCYALALLSLARILATQFDRPYRAFGLVVISIGIMVIANVIQNLQAYLALLNFRGWAPINTRNVGFSATGITLALLISQAFVLWFREIKENSKPLADDGND